MVNQHSAVIPVLRSVGSTSGLRPPSYIAMLTVDELLAFDNVLFHLVYFNIGLALHHSMDLMLQPESLPCMPSARSVKWRLP